MFSLNRRANNTSLALDLLRAAAAEMVCFGHGFVFFHLPAWLRTPQIAFIQNIGVLLFFIMSGFLITATLLQNSVNPLYGFKRYFIDRFARIYSGLIPALVLIVAIDGLTIALTSAPSIARSYTIRTLLANLAMLEGYRGIYDHSSLQWGTFGSASPLWTLAIEWQIYLFVGASFFIWLGRGSWWMLIPIALFSGQTPLHYVFGAFQADGVGTSLFALWLAGAAIYLTLRHIVPPLWVSTLVLACAAVAYWFMLTPGHEYDVTTYPALVLSVGSLIAVTQRTRLIVGARITKIIRLAADYSFTLYLIHHTIMVAVTTIYPAAAGYLWFWGAVLTSNVIAYLIARPFEMRHRQFADWLSRTSSLRIESADPAVALSKYDVH